MIVTDERVPRFVSEKVEKSFCPPYTAMGWERNGKVVSGVLFNVFEGSDMHVTVAGEYFPRAFLTAVGDYAFRQLNAIRCTVITEQEHVVDLAERIGGVKEGLIRSHFGKGRDGVILGILKEDYRFWKE